MQRHQRYINNPIIQKIMSILTLHAFHLNSLYHALFLGKIMLTSKRKRFSKAIIFIGILNHAAIAQSSQSNFEYATISTVDQAIAEITNHNPAVMASWHQFNASISERRAAKANYLPRVELTGETGRISSDNPQFGNENYNSSSAQIVLTQNIFSGGETRYQVKKLDKLTYARFHELRNTSETLALEAVQAYLDVLRYKELVELAKESYIEHRLLYNDIEKRAKAGISRTVDFDQAQARLALAETNLVTESTNLHDVTVRFIRLLGKPPAEVLEQPNIPQALLPISSRLALEEAYKTNPELLAAFYNVRSTEAEVKEKEAAFYPTLDLRARKSIYDDNAVLTPADYDEAAIELVLSYDLYEGGRNSAIKKQYQQLRFAQIDERERVCRNVTQTVSIAFNNVLNLQRQLKLLERNRESIVKVRNAYSKQFSIGQRTLLDLLDTENEYFDVRRAYVNAEYDILTEQIATLAGIGRLTKAFNARGLQDDAQAMIEDTFQDDDLTTCQLNNPRVAIPHQTDILAEVLADRRLTHSISGLLKERAIAAESKYRMSVQYASNSAELLEDHSSAIKNAASYLIENPTVKAVIEGHTDSVGGEAYNMRLSQDRAEAVVSRLINQFGIEPDRLQAVGYGESVPIADNSTPLGREKNRRVLMVIIKE